MTGHPADACRRADYAVMRSDYDAVVSWESNVSEQLSSRVWPSGPERALVDALHGWSKAVWTAALHEGPHVPNEGRLARGLELSARPVFICGVHRSGTTLLRDLLDGHPALSVLPAEGSFLTQMVRPIPPRPKGSQVADVGREWVRRFANPRNQPPYWLLGRTTPVHSPYVLLARMILGWSALLNRHDVVRPLFRPHVAVALACASSLQRMGLAPRAERWVDKTPTNERYLDRLYDAFPDAKVLHVVRSPQAVYQSHKRLEEGAFGCFRHERRALYDMRRSYCVAAANARESLGGRYRVIRYEDLMRSPHAVMVGVARFLDIEVDSTLTSPTVVGVPSPDNSSFRDPGVPGVIQRRASTGRRELSGRERDLVRTFAADGAPALGYPLETLGRMRRWFLIADLHLRDVWRRSRARW